MQHSHRHTSDTNHALARYASYASVSVAAIIILAKGTAWLFSDSLSLLSSFADSILDIAASLINLFALRYAQLPPDDNHRFGHGKAEDIAAFAQSTFITGSALFIGAEAIARLIDPEPIERTMLAIWIMIFSSVLTLMLLCFQHYVVARTKSVVIKADSMHYACDLYVNLTVILALLTVKYLNIQWIDPIFALGIAIYILVGAYRVGKHAFFGLMDTELEEEERNHIKQVIEAHPLLNGYHDLRTRRSGTRMFIQLHAEFDGNMKLSEVHQISDDLEFRLSQAFPNAEITIHQDPEEEDHVKAFP